MLCSCAGVSTERDLCFFAGRARATTRNRVHGLHNAGVSNSAVATTSLVSDQAACAVSQRDYESVNDYSMLAWGASIISFWPRRLFERLKASLTSALISYLRARGVRRL